MMPTTEEQAQARTVAAMSQVDAWKGRFDHDFPNGLLIVPYLSPDEVGTDEDEGDGTEGYAIPYRVSHIDVLGMDTPFSPRIHYSTSMGMLNKDVERVIDTYSVEQTEPFTIARVSCTDGSVSSFSGNVPDGFKAMLEEEARI